MGSEEEDGDVDGDTEDQEEFEERVEGEEISMERLLPHIVLTTQVTHHQSVRDQDLAGAHRAPDWSGGAPGLVVL